VAKANEAQAKAALSQATIGASYTQIRAPFSGIIAQRNVDPGALASPGIPLFTLESMAHFHLQVSVDESKMPSIRQSQSIPIEIDAIAEKEMNGKVIQIYPAGDASSHSFTVKIELPQNAALRSGLFGRANFGSGQRTSIVIPQLAVVRRGNLVSVYVVGADKIAPSSLCHAWQSVRK
jgi:RND family efflux transporter MFP subunit